MKVLLWPWILMVLAPSFGLPDPVMTGDRTSVGSLSVSPQSGISGEFGSWTVSYVVGQDGMMAGGGVRVQLPDAWHAGPRNSALRVQATDPAEENYVNATTTRPGVRLLTVVESQSAERLVKRPRISLDGRSERYVFVVRVVVLSGFLQAGDVIHVVYGDRTGGSPGYRAAAVSGGPDPILLALDSRGTNRFQLHLTTPGLRALPGPPSELQLVGPSQGEPGSDTRWLISAVDKENNPVSEPLQLEITTVTGEGQFPHRVKLAPGRGYARFEVSPKGEGVLRLRARVETSGLETLSNPMLVNRNPTGEKVFWGDLHSHTRFSWDGVGDDAFFYARHVSGLDFYAMTDHLLSPDATGPRGLNGASWAEYTELTERHNHPGSFVTLHGYECSLPAPFGHHNIYFKDAPGPLFYPRAVTLRQIWAVLREGQALTVPHHTGKFPRGIDFSIHDPRFRRNFEIYSAHGLSEAYAPDHPLAFENSDFTAPSTSLPPGTNAQDVWKQGLRLSSLGASDDHRAHPGLPHFGLTAVRAPDLTREAIFRALYERNTYATTGTRIILSVTINGAPMGQTAAFKSPAAVLVQAHGTDLIDRIEVLRYQAGQEDFEVIHRWSPGVLDFRGRSLDSEVRPAAIYYVRLKQDSAVRGRAAMAWSSPVWVGQPAGN